MPCAKIEIATVGITVTGTVETASVWNCSNTGKANKIEAGPRVDWPGQLYILHVLRPHQNKRYFFLPPRGPIVSFQAE